jgi:NADP-dependent 3-hydroxy acid dehydrogenase YdfG
MELQIGDVAIVSGAASGIGRALAEGLGRRGVHVVLTDRDADAVHAARDALAATGASASAEALDVTDADAVARVVADTEDRCGRVDLVAANAGVPGHPARLWETPLADWRWVVDVNLWGVVHLLHAAVPGMVARDRGHVLVTASIAAWSAGPAMAPYAATKHALLGLAESLHRDLAGSGSAVGVTVLCPGAVATAFNERSQWPDRLGPRPPVRDDAVAAGTVDMLTRGITEGVDPSVAADAALAAVGDGRFVASSDPAWVVHTARTRVAVAEGADPPRRRHVPDRAP